MLYLDGTSALYLEEEQTAQEAARDLHGGRGDSGKCHADYWWDLCPHHKRCW